MRKHAGTLWFQNTGKEGQEWIKANCSGKERQLVPGTRSIYQSTYNEVEFFSRVTNHGVYVVTSIQTLWNINDLLHYKYESNITTACVLDFCPPPLPSPQLNFLAIRFISNFPLLNTVSNIEVWFFQCDKTNYRNKWGVVSESLVHKHVSIIRADTTPPPFGCFRQLMHYSSWHTDSS